MAGPSYDVVNNVGSVVFADGAGADRGWLERDDGQYDEPRRTSSPGAGGACCCAPSTSPTWGCSTSASSSTTRTPTCRGGAGRGGWRYRTGPLGVVRHLHAASSGEGSSVFELPRRAQPAAHAGEGRPGPDGGPGGLALPARAPPPTPGATWSAPLRRGSRPGPAGGPPPAVASFAGFLRLLPAMLRRAPPSCVGAQLVPDAELWVGWCGDELAGSRPRPRRAPRRRGLRPLLADRRRRREVRRPGSPTC